jgi:hypothetical protein
MLQLTSNTAAGGINITICTFLIICIQLYNPDNYTNIYQNKKYPIVVTPVSSYKLIADVTTMGYLFNIKQPLAFLILA